MKATARKPARNHSKQAELLQLEVRRIGNSAGLLFPSALLKMANLTVEQAVQVRLEGDQLTLTPVRPRLTLEKLMAEHATLPPEMRADESWDKAPLVGKEDPNHPR